MGCVSIMGISERILAAYPINPGSR